MCINICKMAEEIVGFPKLKVDDLKRELHKRGLPVRGTKAELQERLLEYLKQDIRVDPAEDTTEKSDEEDDANDELDATDELKNTTTEDVDLAVTDTSEIEGILEVKSPDDDLKQSNPPKKTKSDKLSEASPVPVKPLKNITEEEKRTARMKRFGEVTNEVDKKKMRAERFKTGDSSLEVTYNGKSITGDEMDKLKKRANRFGVVSPVMEKLDENDRKLKRQQRFGTVTSLSTKPLPDSLAARKKKRMERFGQV